MKIFNLSIDHLLHLIGQFRIIRDNFSFECRCIHTDDSLQIVKLILQRCKFGLNVTVVILLPVL
jgi:hypothetical protein